MDIITIGGADVKNNAAIREFKKYKSQINNIEEIIEAVDKARNFKEKPTMIVCHTVKGKGVSFMENQASWHGTAPSKEQCTQALSEIGGDN